MGKQNDTNGIVETLEDVLGLDDENTDDNTNSENGSSESSEQNEETKNNNDSFPGENGNDPKEQKQNNTDQDKKEKDQKQETRNNTTVTLTQEQIEISKEITKIDTELEKLAGDNTVEVKDFYNSLDDLLSDDEKQLEFDDKLAYLELVDNKKTEYIKDHSNDEKIAQLTEKKEEYQRIYQRQEGIVAVTAEYSDFDYEKTMEFFENKLNKEQQQEVFEGAESYADVYKNAYKLMTGNDTKEIDSQKAPDVPNVNNVRKTTVTKDTIDNGLKTEEEETLEALGL